MQYIYFGICPEGEEEAAPAHLKLHHLCGLNVMLQVKRDQTPVWSQTRRVCLHFSCLNVSPEKSAAHS